jgi:hypothetical protein
MELDTITMPRAEARKAYLEYREAIQDGWTRELDDVRRRQLEQDQVIAATYRQLSIGRQVLRLTPTITAGGFDDQGRPRMALSRADIAEIQMERWRSGQIRFRPWEGSNWSSAQAHRAADKVIVFDGPGTDLTGIEGLATVPPIPPALRPAGHLRNYHILFEATWRPVRQTRTRLRSSDPALLKWMGGELYAVLAVWDVSPVEAAALEGGWL